MPDPFKAVADVIIGWRNIDKAQQWFRLLFSMGASYGLSFSTAAGTALIAGADPARAAGYGLVSGAAMAYVAYINAKPKLKSGTTIAVLQKTVEDQFTDGIGAAITTAKD